MKRLSLIVLVLSFAITTPVTATDKDGYYMTQSAISCGKYVEGRIIKGISHTSFLFWINGYITAYNKQTPDVYNILDSTDEGSVYLWMY